MLVRFKSAHYDGSYYWPIGVHEFPEKINGRKVVFFKAGEAPEEGTYVLPRTAEPAEKKDPSPLEKEEPKALSEIANTGNSGFVEAMKPKK
jgi:hypothetical protein